MTGVRAGLGVAALVLVVTAPPSGAAPGPQATDRCGDAASGVEVQVAGRTVRQDVEAARGDIDIAAVQVRLTAEGSALEATVTTCGAASDDVVHLVQWAHGDGAYSSLAYVPRWAREGRLAPEVRFTEVQYGERRSRVVPSTGPRVVSEVTLPTSAYRVEGRTATITLPLRAVPRASAPRFRTGSRWRTIGAVTQDPDVGTWQLGRGTEPLPSHDTTVRLDTANGGDWTVGPDER